jgi:hypothetical protein
MKGGYKRNSISKTTARRKPARRSTRLRNSPRRRSTSRNSLKRPILSITPESISISSDMSEFLNNHGIQTSSRRRPQLIIESSPPVSSAEPVVIESPTEIEITPQRRTRRRTMPTLIIASDTTEEIEPRGQTVVAQEISPVSVRSINSEDEELADLFLNDREEFYRRMRSARGIKRNNKNRISKKNRKSKIKTRKHHK